MYKYFSELDNPNAFKIYLLRHGYRNQDHEIFDFHLPPDIFDGYEALFEQIKTVDMFIEGTNEKIKYHAKDYDEWDAIGNFFSHKEEWYEQMKSSLSRNLNPEYYECDFLFSNYETFCYCLRLMYPEFEQLFSSTANMIMDLREKMKMKRTIKIPLLSEGITINWPNNWYITPNGHLYSPGEKDGHKEGRLVYPYWIILETFRNNEEINFYNLDSETKTIFNLDDETKVILERGYITCYDFRGYCGLPYTLPTIKTPEVEHDFERLRVLKDHCSLEEIFKIPYGEYPATERSYQKNMITLRTGYNHAKTALYQSFARLNNSNRKKEIINELIDETIYDLNDVFVRFCGFHKVESTVDKTITTSSLNAVEQFGEYLNRGWNLHIIPGFVYDKTTDKLSEVDMNSYFVKKYLDQELNRYKGKGKVLIYNQNENNTLKQ